VWTTRNAVCFFESFLLVFHFVVAFVMSSNKEKARQMGGISARPWALYLFIQGHVELQYTRFRIFLLLLFGNQCIYTYCMLILFLLTDCLIVMVRIVQKIMRIFSDRTVHSDVTCYLTRLLFVVDSRYSTARTVYRSSLSYGTTVKEREILVQQRFCLS
jgi:hypothetical protein